jgi:hypothetical protein
MLMLSIYYDLQIIQYYIIVESYMYKNYMYVTERYQSYTVLYILVHLQHCRF